MTVLPARVPLTAICFPSKETERFVPFWNVFHTLPSASTLTCERHVSDTVVCCVKSPTSISLLMLCEADDLTVFVAAGLLVFAVSFLVAVLETDAADVAFFVTVVFSDFFNLPEVSGLRTILTTSAFGFAAASAAPMPQETKATAAKSAANVRFMIPPQKVSRRLRERECPDDRRPPSSRPGRAVSWPGNRSA